MVGWLVLSRDSTHPVHSWPESHITGGLCGEVMASAICGIKLAESPMEAAIPVQNFIKSLRLTPLNWVFALSTTFGFISYLLVFQLALCIHTYSTSVFIAFSIGSKRKGPVHLATSGRYLFASVLIVVLWLNRRSMQVLFLSEVS